MSLSIRDCFWLMILALVLAAWGWDRGRLATRLEAMTAPQMGPGMGGIMGGGYGSPQQGGFSAFGGQ